MLDPLVKIDHVQNITGFDPQTLLPTRQVQVTYHIGTHGPFLLVTPQASFGEEYLEKETGKVVATLRAAGALDPGNPGTYAQR